MKIVVTQKIHSRNAKSNGMQNSFLAFQELRDLLQKSHKIIEKQIKLVL